MHCYKHLLAVFHPLYLDQSRGPSQLNYTNGEYSCTANTNQTIHVLMVNHCRMALVESATRHNTRWVTSKQSAEAHGCQSLVSLCMGHMSQWMGKFPSTVFVAGASEET